MARIAVLLLVVIIGVSTLHAPAFQPGAALPSQDGASLGSIIVGLMLLAPAVGIFRWVRAIGRWQSNTDRKWRDGR